MRSILISGGSRGIGRKIAERMLLDGHKVSLGVRKPNVLLGSSLDPSLNDNKHLIVNQYEARKEESAIELVNNTISEQKSIDTLINCAGTFCNTGLLFKDDERYKIDELWDVNLMGPWLLTKAAWTYLIKSKNSRVITLVSMSGKRSKGDLAAYSVTKFALMGLCQTIRNKGWDKGVRVTTISPSWVNTDMAANITSMKKEEMTQPEDIASIVSNLLTLPNSSIPFEINLNCNLEI